MDVLDVYTYMFIDVYRCVRCIYIRHICTCLCMYKFESAYMRHTCTSLRCTCVYICGHVQHNIYVHT